MKQKLLPLHHYIGALTFIMAFVTVMTGIPRMNEFVARTTGKSYAEYPAWSIVSNFYALFTGVFVLLIMIVITNSAFKRQSNHASSAKDEKAATQF